ncbi:MAG: EutN/CcmL family microcompartment protein [Planctomycetes bacterium]|nr:EutN/CcmL family microcompartment protein [Planctomycetota bacterium]
MILGIVTGQVWATRRNPRLSNKRCLIVQPVLPDRKPTGQALLALDVVDAGPGDCVLVNKEGSGARLIFDDATIPVQAVIVGVVDRIDKAASSSK